MTARVTAVPTEPVQQSGQPDPWAVGMKALDTLGRLVESQSADKPHGGEPVRMAILAAVLTSALLWGAHEVLGGRAAAERSERLEARVERLEQMQTDIRIDLAAIARAVGAEPVKER